MSWASSAPWSCWLPTVTTESSSVYPCRRFWLLQDAGRDIPEVGRARYRAGRHGAGDSHVSPGRDLHSLSRQLARRPRPPPSFGNPDPRGVSRSRRSRALPRAGSRRPATLAGEEALHGQCPRERGLDSPVGDFAIDPLLGETYVQFAWKGLKHQLSQGAGSWTLPEGRRTSYYKLIDSALPKPPAADAHESDFFDGIDTSLPGLASRLGADEAKAPWLRPQLEAIAKTVDEATAAAR